MECITLPEPRNRQRLEEGVGEQVEHGGHDREEHDLADTRAQGHEHVAKLADGGVGQHAFQVVLGEGDQGGHQGGGCADDADDHGHQRVVEDQRGRAGDEVNAGGDHGGGVDEGRDGRGAFHGVGQPDIEGDLGTLGGGGPEQQQSDAELGGGGHHPQVRFAQDIVVADVVAVGSVPHPEDGDGESDVADPVHQERLLGGGGGGGLGVPEADEEV